MLAPVESESPLLLAVVAAAVEGEFGDQPAGGWIRTMLPHFGHSWIWPMTSGLRIFSRERHVSQMIRNGSTKRPVSRVSMCVSGSENVGGGIRKEATRHSLRERRFIAYPKIVGDFPNVAESSEQTGTGPFSETVLG